MLLSVQDAGFGLEHAQKALDDFGHQDDKYINIGDIAARLARSRLFESIYTKESTRESASLPPWPYFIHGKSIHQVWKLYEDDLDAFVVPIITDDVSNSKSFSVLQAVLKHGSFRSIAVPSRLYSSPSKEKPLAGARVSIKDNYDLNGIRTTIMNRAYNELYPACTASTDYVVKLIELGAIIVGKTKMSAFASAEEPTDQCIDYHCLFDPRGNKCQTPSCSSTSAGASLAEYS